ncbi:MAG: hypothetical protein ACUVRC_00365 [Desulfotomaculales bacterium]
MLLVVFISRLRQKFLFGLRLFLLLAILTVLTTQIYTLVKPDRPARTSSQVITPTRSNEGDSLGSLLRILKNYYRGW